MEPQLDIHEFDRKYRSLKALAQTIYPRLDDDMLHFLVMGTLRENPNIDISKITTHTTLSNYTLI